MKQNKIICISIIIVLVSLVLPKISLYLLEEKQLEKMVDITANTLATNNVKVENSIIKTVYSKYNNEKYSVSTSGSMEFTEMYKQIDDEVITNDTLVSLSELESIGMIEPVFFTDIAQYENMSIRKNDFKGESITYSRNRIFLPNDNYATAFMSFEIENISSKIISLKIPKNYINTTKEIMKKYIEYLGLNDTDWVYETNSIKSINKKIEIKIEDINNIVSVSIVPYNT